MALADAEPSTGPPSQPPPPQPPAPFIINPQDPGSSVDPPNIAPRRRLRLRIGSHWPRSATLETLGRCFIIICTIVKILTDMYIHLAVLHVILDKNHVYAYRVLTVLFSFTDSKESMISCWTNAIARSWIVPIWDIVTNASEMNYMDPNLIAKTSPFWNNSEHGKLWYTVVFQYRRYDSLWS